MRITFRRLSQADLSHMGAGQLTGVRDLEKTILNHVLIRQLLRLKWANAIHILPPVFEILSGELQW